MFQKSVLLASENLVARRLFQKHTPGIPIPFESSLTEGFPSEKSEKENRSRCLFDIDVLSRSSKNGLHNNNLIPFLPTKDFY
jgi:hypothetical protein